MPDTQGANKTAPPDARQIAQLIALRGLSIRDAAKEVGVEKGVIESLLDGRKTREDNLEKLAAWVADQPRRFREATGLAVPGTLDYWRGRVEQMARSLGRVLADTDEIAAQMQAEIEKPDPLSENAAIKAAGAAEAMRRAAAPTPPKRRRGA